MSASLWVGLGAAAVVAGSGAVTTSVGPWYRALRKPWFNPPDWVFGPAWTTILALQGWSASLAWDASAGQPGLRARVLTLFLVNVALHVAWSPLFFRFRRPDWALIEVVFLWLSLAALIVGLAPISPLAAWLIAPYLVWVSFASFLNLTIVRMNRPFGGT
jgi:tryptophan-rich sensory protein